MREVAKGAARKSLDILGHNTHHTGEVFLRAGRFVPILGRGARQELAQRNVISANFHRVLNFRVGHPEQRTVMVERGRFRKRQIPEVITVMIDHIDPATGQPPFRIVDQISDIEQVRMRQEVLRETPPAILQLARQMWDPNNHDPRLIRLRDEAAETYRMGLLIDRDTTLGNKYPETQPKRAAPQAVRAITSVVNLGTDIAALSAGAPLGGHIARSLIKGVIFHFGIPRGVAQILPDIIWDNSWVRVGDYSIGFDKSLKKAQETISSLNPQAARLLYPDERLLRTDEETRKQFETTLDQLMKAAYYFIPGVGDRFSNGALDPRGLKFRAENSNVAAYEYYYQWLENTRPASPQTDGRR